MSTLRQTIEEIELGPGTWAAADVEIEYTISACVAAWGPPGERELQPPEGGEVDLTALSLRAATVYEGDADGRPATPDEWTRIATLLTKRLNGDWQDRLIEQAIEQGDD